ncbi:MAG: ankyrin repeat domain-containing protein, partial [Pseudomonadota bacterium]
SAHMGRKELAAFLLKSGAPYSLPTAVMMGDYTTVKRLLNEDPERIHERAAHDFALLWYPIIGQCDLDMMQLLLDKGAKVEEQHYLGTTALHWACIRGPIELTELLLEFDFID